MRTIPGVFRAGLLLLLALGGCSYIRTVEVEVFEPLPAEPLRKLLVVGIHENGRTRRLFENALVAELAGHGAEGIPSYRFVYEEAALNVANVIRAVEEAKVDGVITARVLDAELRGRPTRLQQTPTEQEPFDLQSAPPHPVPNLMPRKPSQVTIQTNTYRVVGKALLLTATSRAVNPESVEEVCHEVSRETVRSLAQEKILPR